MRRAALVVLLVSVAGALGVAGTYLWLSRRAPQVDPPVLVTQIREVARLETLEVRLYKKVSFTPDPPASASLWVDVANWAKFKLRNPRGKAIIFAVAHLGLDLGDFSEKHLRVVGPDVEVTLPPLRVQVELLPGETEVIGSNLSSEETAQLFEKARLAFEAEVRGDRQLLEKARNSGRRQIQALLLTTGFREVRFVDSIPKAMDPG